MAAPAGILDLRGELESLCRGRGFAGFAWEVLLHRGIQQGALDAPVAAMAPSGHYHVLDEIDFGGVRGLQAMGIGVQESGEFFARLILEQHFIHRD